MQGSLFRNVAPYGRLRLHLNLALWHLRQSVLHSSAADDKGIEQWIDIMIRGASDTVKETLDMLGGVHPINTEDQ